MSRLANKVMDSRLQQAHGEEQGQPHHHDRRIAGEPRRARSPAANPGAEAAADWRRENLDGSTTLQQGKKELSACHINPQSFHLLILLQVISHPDPNSNFIFLYFVKAFLNFGKSL